VDVAMRPDKLNWDNLLILKKHPEQLEIFKKNSRRDITEDEATKTLKLQYNWTGYEITSLITPSPDASNVQ
ncbi:hypothetical protein L9F63_009321, partial [Diploptera punctata]